MMIPMHNFDDEWIAAVGSFVRYNFGNSGGFITPADVARVRAATAGRKEIWTLPELLPTIPAPVYADGWKLTASHNPEAAVGAVSLTGWNAGGPQETGMWFQVGLPRPETVTEVQFQSPAPGGRGGAGSAAATSRTGAPVAGRWGFPRAFRVEVSTDGSSWTQVSQGGGSGLTTTATFEPTRARFLRVTLTAGDQEAPAWSIQSLKIFSVAAAVKENGR